MKAQSHPEIASAAVANGSPPGRPYLPPQRPSWRLLSWAVGVGVILLAGSAILVAMHSHSRADGPAAPASKDERKPVAVAFVDVEDGVRSLYPAQNGRVVAVPAQEGVEVPEGTLLLQVDDTLAKAQLSEAEIALQAARKRVEAAERSLNQHKEQVAAQRAAIDHAKAKKAAAQANADKLERFHNKRIGGIQKEDVEAAKKLVDEAAAGVRVEQAKLKALDTMKPDLAVDLAQLDVKAKQEQLVKAKQAVKECSILAPCKGQLLRKLANVGEVLGPNPKHPALLFCPAGERIVRAEVEQEFAAGVKKDQKAVIKDDATGSGEWHGTVTRVSDWYTQRRSVLLEPLQFNDIRTLEVIIRLEDGKDQLRIGQRVLVTLKKAGS